VNTDAMYSREELLQWLRDLGEKGRPPMQADLADAVGVSPSAVAHWETRDVAPTPENAGRLHEALRRLQDEEKS